MLERSKGEDFEKTSSPEGWEAFLEDQPIIPEEIEKYDHLKIDNSKTFWENYEGIVEYLGN